MSNINRVNYLGYDFVSVVEELQNLIQATYQDDYNDFATTAAGQMLIDIAAYALDVLSFYLDRRASDTYITTTTARKAVDMLTRQLGYKMRGAIASSTEIQVTLSQTYAFPITIPTGFQWLSSEGIVFETSEEVTFAVGETEKAVPVYQGETFTETFVGTGLANQRYELTRLPDGTGVAGGTSVTVDGSAWDEYATLPYGNTNTFEMEYNQDPPRISFGDGIVGAIPAQSYTIVVSYIATQGLTGQVTSNTITKVRAPLVANATTILLTVNNAEGSVGGADRESLVEAKANGPSVWKTRNAAITREDYESHGTAYADPLAGTVATAQAISSRSASSDLELRTRLSDIDAAVQTPVPTVTSALAAARADLTSADTALSSLEDKLTDIASKNTLVDTGLIGAISSARTVKNKSDEVSNDSSDIQAFTVSGKAAVDAIATGVVDTLTDPTKAALKGYFTSINTEALGISSSSASLKSSAESEIATIAQARDDLAEVGLTVTASGLLNDAETLRTTVVTALGAESPPSGVREDLQTIEGAVVDVSSEVEGYTSAIFAHVDSYLASDCKANLVTVPILAKDAAGFYTAPSVALVKSLQAYYDARKEVTQTVKVTSGSLYLVEADISVRVGVLPGYSHQVVSTTVRVLVEGVLRGRAFGASLYLKALYAALDGLDGVAFLNVAIPSHTSVAGGTTSTKIDASGNLIISSEEVVTKGTITVESEDYET